LLFIIIITLLVLKKPSLNSSSSNLLNKSKISDKKRSETKENERNKRVREYSDKVRQDNKQREKDKQKKESKEIHNESVDFCNSRHNDCLLKSVIKPCQYESVSSNIQRTQFVKEMNRINNKEIKLENELRRITQQVNDKAKNYKKDKSKIIDLIF